jgi:hypothetical protein
MWCIGEQLNIIYNKLQKNSFKISFACKIIFREKDMKSFSKVIPLALSYKFCPISWRFRMLDKDFQDVHWCIIETLLVHLVTSCRWVQMEVAHLFWNQLCSHMIIVLARCQHIFFQAHLCTFGIEKGFQVDVTQHLVWEEHKSRTHFFS